MDWIKILVAALALIIGWYLTAKAVGYLLLVWFDDAKFFVEYGRIFKIGKAFPHFRKFLESKDKGSSLSYLDYISQSKDGFLTRLVTCEKCLAPWLSGVFLLPLLVFLGIYYPITIPLFPTLIFAVANQSISEFQQLK